MKCHAIATKEAQIQLDSKESTPWRIHMTFQSKETKFYMQYTCKVTLSLPSSSIVEQLGHCKTKRYYIHNSFKIT